MVLSILAALGRMIWPAVAALAPAASPRVTMALLILTLAALAIGAPAGAVWLAMHGRIASERRAVDLRWQAEILKDRETHAQALEAARRAADTVLPTPGDAALRLRACAASPTCRDRDGAAR